MGRHPIVREQSRAHRKAMRGIRFIFLASTGEKVAVVGEYCDKYGKAAVQVAVGWDDRKYISWWAEELMDTRNKGKREGALAPLPYLFLVKVIPGLALLRALVDKSLKCQAW